MINGKEIQKTIFAGVFLMFASLILIFYTKESMFIKIIGLLGFLYFACALIATLLHYYYPIARICIPYPQITSKKKRNK
jgi:predicted membrane protein